MTSYRRTIQRHKLILSLPIVLVVMLALWTTAGAPSSYEATASLWVDNLPPADSSLTMNDPSVRQPADQAQLFITELLQTRDFRLKVGRQGPLAAYIASNPSKGWGPLALLSALRGQQPLDVAIISELGPERFVSVVAGPQVLQLNYQAATPELASGTLKTLLAEIGEAQKRFARERVNAKINYNKAQVEAGTEAVADARNKLTGYTRANPDADSSDPHLVALQRTMRSATKDLTRLTTQLNQSSVAQNDPLAGTASPATTGISVIDTPKAPAGPVSGKKQLVMALFGGTFAGALLSFLALIALTPSKPSEPYLRPVETPKGEPVAVPNGKPALIPVHRGLQAAEPDHRPRHWSERS